MKVVRGGYKSRPRSWSNGQGEAQTACRLAGQGGGRLVGGDRLIAINPDQDSEGGQALWTHAGEAVGVGEPNEKEANRQTVR